MAQNEPNKQDDVKPSVSDEPSANEPSVKESIEPPAPVDVSTSNDVVVPFKKISELVNERKAAMPDEKKLKNEKSAQSDKPSKTDKAEQKPKAEKVIEEKKTPTPAEYKERGKKAAATRKASRNMVDDFVEGKRTSPLPSGTPIDEQPVQPREAPRSGEHEQIVHINLSELFPFKDHPFKVRNDDEMAAMVESVKDKGITNAAIVRPREGGGYEMISGHRRQMASELAGFTNMPCIIRNLTDEQAITQMVEDNTTQRESILPSERAKALKMQLDAIKKQGARGDLGATTKAANGERSNAIVAERNKMTVKQVQRYIKLNDLVPDLLKLADEKKIAFTPAIELAHIKPKNQRYIAIAIEGQQSAPSLSQAQRMRDLDQKGVLNPDMIDGIMLEEKKEVDKVIISSQELSQYFGKDKTPRDMKDQIIKLLDEWKGQQKDIAAPEKKSEQEK